MTISGKKFLPVITSSSYHTAFIPFVFHPEKEVCFYSLQGVYGSLINVRTFQATPSVFLGDIFRQALSTILKWKARELFLLMIVLPLQCDDSWWAGASIRHKRPEWVGVGLWIPLSGEPVTEIIKELVTRDCPWISTRYYFWIAAGLFWV